MTVALPTCDGARHLRAAFAGIRDQGSTPFDMVISDDRSDDGTLAMVAELFGDRARVSVNSERLGLAGNWNRCAELSRTEHVAIFHQDDVMKPGHLAAHLAAFQLHPHLGLVASAAEVIDGEGRDVPETVVGRGGCGDRDRTFEAGEFVEELAIGNPLRCSAVSLSARAHEAVGGFDPAFRYVVDWDFWLKVARRYPVAWLASPTVAIRWHPASETHRFKHGTADLDETSRLLDEIERVDGIRLRSLGEWRRMADRRVARAFLNRAHESLKSGNVVLARSCLHRLIGLSPATLGSIARDPRLAVQMAALVIAPRLAARWFGHRQG